ncbi:MAG TPA: ABC transporter permease [Dehalococcoidia bacterium]|nr:ABC transporter permease [Dehalococcoidia bacterium]
MLSLFRSEMFKLRHRMMTRVLLVIVVAAPLAAYVLLGLTGNSDDGSIVQDLRLSSVHDNSSFIIYQLTVVAAVVLAASSIASEFAWGTIRTLVPRSAGRSPLLTAKLMTLLLFVAVSVVLGFMAALAGSLIVTTLRDLDSSLGPNFAGRLLVALVETSYVCLPYACMAFVVALWTRSSAAGIAVPIVAFYAEVLLTPAFTSIDALKWLPDALIYSANVSALVGSDAILDKSDLPGRLQAAGVLGAYAAVFVSLAYARFLTRDITS